MHPMHFSPSCPPLRWDIFCQVIDNLGDIGVCWRLSADLAARGHQVRLWVDDASPLQWMAPGALQGAWPGVEVRNWEQSRDAAILAKLTPADVWIEGFGCEIATEFIAANAYSMGAISINEHKTPTWINLEYLSAQDYVERSHGLPSPVMQGPGRGRIKYFYYPGFTGRTGGLLREPDLLLRQQAFEQKTQRAAWLAQHGIAWQSEQLISLFCYEPAMLAALLEQLDAQPTPTRLLVTAGRAQRAVQALAPALQRLHITYLPLLTQSEFDQLLCICDLNFVRGEDSLVRALWAGKPMVWQIYPQEDTAHHDKLDAFLDMLGASASVRAFHHAWNGMSDTPGAAALPPIDLVQWGQVVQSTRHRLLQMDDLVTQLVNFVQKKR